MLKSILVVTISAFMLKSTKALWSLMFICALAVAGAIHLLVHDHIGSANAIKNLAELEIIGSVAYVLGIALF